jgi:hypothetical protein
MAPRLKRRQRRLSNWARRQLRLESLEARHLLASYTIAEDTQLTIAIPTGQQAVVDTQPAHGDVVPTNIGNLVYLPDANYHGSDAFTYRLGNDTTQHETATIAITPVNDPPVARPNEYSMSQGTTLRVDGRGVLANDTDVDTENLTAVLVHGPVQGTLSLAANGSLTYTPPADFTGVATFTYRANDGVALSNTATVAIAVRPVNHPPEARNDTYTASENTVLIVDAPGVLANDGGTATMPLTATLVTPPTHGTLSLNANGSFTYAPAENFVGAVSFVYRASSPPTTTDPATGSNSSVTGSTATVTIYVISLSPTVFAQNDRYATPVNTTLKVDPPGVLANDSTLILYPFTTGNGPPTAPIRIVLKATLITPPAEGTLLLTDDGGFTYEPKADFQGAVSFVYRASARWPSPVAAAADGHADDIRPLDTSIATATIFVGRVNEPPLARNDEYATDQGTRLEIAAPGVLANDVGIPGLPLAAHLVTGPGNGDVSLNANGGFTYAPKEGFNGTDRFTYRVSYATAAGTTDNNTPGDVATVFIRVRPIIRPPQAHDDFYRTRINTPLEVEAPGVLKNDVGAPDHRLAARLVEGPDVGELRLNGDGSFRYEPKENFVGRVRFTYRAVYAPTPTPAGADDNRPIIEGSVATVVIFVGPQLPVAHDDLYSVLQGGVLEVEPPGVLKNDEGAPGHTLNAILLQQPENGELTLKEDGSFRYVPKAGYSGPDSFTYRALDATPSPDPTLGGNSATNLFAPPESNVATVRIRVVPVVPYPIARPDEYSTPRGTSLTVEAPGVLKNDIPPGDQDLAALLIARPAHGTLSLNRDGSFTYVPAAGFTGLDGFLYQAAIANATDPASDVPIVDSIARVTIRVTHPRAIRNIDRPLDVNGDRNVSAIDALILVNLLHRESGEGESSADGGSTFCDVSGDGFISAIDPLLVFNHLNAQSATVGGASASGESDDAVAGAAAASDFDQESADLMTLLAYDAADEAANRRRRGL